MNRIEITLWIPDECVTEDLEVEVPDGMKLIPPAEPRVGEEIGFVLVPRLAWNRLQGVFDKFEGLREAIREARVCKINIPNDQCINTEVEFGDSNVGLRESEENL
jgi:hypothetical protein